ncbi:MAG TPA: CGNR zinc finger domain-containing protein [Candidatus Micrarchaeia archaeon]|nr:CGNR zinc finger domain-containing protein [Candidatus Micrarchaeia archaeon]
MVVSPTQAMGIETREDAPGSLRLVQELVNTADLEGGTDELDSAERVGLWLAVRGFQPAGPPVGADRERAVALREALRQLLLANNGAASGVAAATRLAAVAGAVQLVPAASPAGSVELRPAGRGVSALTAAVLAAIHEAQARGTWDRLKACPADTCRYAFYDSSRNRSGIWCTMRVCGSRAKARTYQRRLRAGRGAPDRPARRDRAQAQAQADDSPAANIVAATSACSTGSQRLRPPLP